MKLLTTLLIFLCLSSHAGMMLNRNAYGRRRPPSPPASSNIVYVIEMDVSKLGE